MPFRLDIWRDISRWKWESDIFSELHREHERQGAEALSYANRTIRELVFIEEALATLRRYAARPDEFAARSEAARIRLLVAKLAGKALIRHPFEATHINRVPGNERTA